jgi:hypothetical protein
VTAGLLVIAADVVQAPNDKQQLEPMLASWPIYPTNWARPTRYWRTTVISVRAM